MLNIFQRYVIKPSLSHLLTRNQDFIPGLVGTGEAFTTPNWAYKTIPQEHLRDGQLVIDAGNALAISTYNPFS